MSLREVTDRAEWDSFVSTHPWGHPLQLWGWGEAKRSNKWLPTRLILESDGRPMAGAQVLLWPIPRLGRYIAYIPRGPVADPFTGEGIHLLGEVIQWAKAHKALYVRVEPAWISASFPRGWRRAANTLQMTETFTLDLTKSEDELQEPMARKHRQYIRKAERDGVRVERVEGDQADLTIMYDLYLETASRAGFGIHPPEYYEELFRAMGEHSYLYYAYVGDEPVAFLWLAAAGPVAYELYGGVSGQGQEAKANYLLKWQAIVNSKQAGYRLYDFNGRLNEGVSQFKAGFAPAETDYVGTYDYPISKLGYQAWERLWPVAKPVGRRVMKAINKKS
jgi:peptidoglycan pentaglycine glycine transferase (the first glycine)